MDVKLSLVKYMTKCYSMNNTNNKYREMSYKEREGSRMSQNVHTEFVNKKVWDMFKKRFKSHTTEASYWSDITEFCRFCGKKAEDTEKKDVDRYYSYMKKKAESGNDYVYVNCFEETVKNPGAVSRYVSDRHFGIGSYI